MTNNYSYSVINGVQKIKSKAVLITTALTMAVSGGGLAAVSLSGIAHAASSSATKSTATQFTPSVVSGLTVDRTAPSGGYKSTSFGGRSNVLEMNIDSENRSTAERFYYTEGLQQAVNGQTSAKADLYVPSSWTTTPVRAGIWGVGNNTAGEITAYPIAEFANTDGYVGWRVFNDEQGGWVNFPAIPYTTNGWNTVGFTYNATTTKFDFTINGKSAGSSFATGSVNLSAVIFNSFNFGTGNPSYGVHWSNLVTSYSVTGDKDSCKDNGWDGLTLANGTTFKNQGACVSYFTSNKSKQ